MKEVGYRLGELFCGGGLALGAKSASIISHNCKYQINHAWATDWDSSACETYRYNICPERPESVVCCDIRQLSFERLQNLSSIDGLAFGFPCNDFSVVGERLGIHGMYGSLYQYAVEALNFFNPQWFVGENVSGLRNSNGGRALEIILEALRTAGNSYEVTAHLYEFEYYGIPQTRHRIIIVGIRKDIGKVFRVPSPDLYKDIDVSCQRAIENPPIPSSAFNHEPTKQSLVVIERLKYIKPGENVFTAAIPAELRLNVCGARISQIYKRLHPSKPAYTITGSGGGGTHVYHWSEHRSLTNRERARLQTFPDNFIFYGSKGNVRRQIGMAVPPRFGTIIFNALLSSLLDIPYPSIPSNITRTSSLFAEVF